MAPVEYIVENYGDPLTPGVTYQASLVLGDTGGGPDPEPGPHIVETITGLSPGASATIPISTSLVPTDLVVLVVGKQSAAGSATPFGPDSAVWTTRRDQTGSGNEVRITTTTGLTGAGSITLNGVALNDYYSVYILRSATPDTPVVFESSTGVSSAATGAGTAFKTGPVVAVADAIAIAIANGTANAPTAASTPASGWTIDRASDAVKGVIVHQSIPAGGTGELALTTDALGYVTAAIALFSDA